LKSILRYKKDSKILQEFKQLGPISVRSVGDFDVREHFSEYDDEEIFNGSAGDIYEEIFKKGIRPSYEMEDVRPKADLQIYDGDPVFTISEWLNEGKIDFEAAKTRIQNLIQDDIRYLDAYAHLGIWYFDSNMKIFDKSALKNFKAGSALGYLSIEKYNDAVFPWGWIGNRPFFRCLHGYGLTLWKMKRPDDAMKVFTQMLWWNPTDNQGVRFCIEAIEIGMSWKEFTKQGH
jgi:hypothetical protein